MKDLDQAGAYSAQVRVFEEEKFRKQNSKGSNATCHITKYLKTFLLNSFLSQIGVLIGIDIKIQS